MKLIIILILFIVLSTNISSGSEVIVASKILSNTVEINLSRYSNNPSSAVVIEIPSQVLENIEFIDRINIYCGYNSSNIPSGNFNIRILYYIGNFIEWHLVPGQYYNIPVSTCSDNYYGSFYLNLDQINMSYFDTTPNLGISISTTSINGSILISKNVSILNPDGNFILPLNITSRPDLKYVNRSSIILYEYDPNETVNWCPISIFGQHIIPTPTPTISPFPTGTPVSGNGTNNGTGIINSSEVYDPNVNGTYSSISSESELCTGAGLCTAQNFTDWLYQYITGLWVLGYFLFIVRFYIFGSK